MACVCLLAHACWHNGAYDGDPGTKARETLCRQRSQSLNKVVKSVECFLNSIAIGGLPPFRVQQSCILIQQGIRDTKLQESSMTRHRLVLTSDYLKKSRH